MFKHRFHVIDNNVTINTAKYIYIYIYTLRGVYHHIVINNMKTVFNVTYKKCVIKTVFITTFCSSCI